MPRYRDDIKLRAAAPADLALLQYWDEQPHVIASAPNDDWDWKKELSHTPDWRELLIAELDVRPVGVVQIIDPAREETHYWGEIEDGYRAIDIWIGEASDLGKGYGTTIMSLALDRCFSSPEVSAVVIDPLATNTRAHTFYERLGFKFVERRYFDRDDCFVYRLDQHDWYSKKQANFSPDVTILPDFNAERISADLYKCNHKKTKGTESH